MTHIKSMTAFGRAELACKRGRLVCELQSLNRRYFDCQLSLPSWAFSIEISLRQKLAKRVGRGQVSCRFYFEKNVETTMSLELNQEKFPFIQKAWNQVAHHFGYEPQVPLSFLMSFREELGAMPDNREDIACFEPLLEKAIDALQLMKEKEGQALALDLAEHIQSIAQRVAIIEQLSAEAINPYRQKLTDRIQAYLDAETLDNRLLAEIALFADKIDISEEIVRFKSHVQQLSDWLKTDSAEGQAKGKLGEFILQEMGREINTMGSKCSDIRISRLVIECKSYLERLKEQVQNVE